MASFIHPFRTSRTSQSVSIQTFCAPLLICLVASWLPSPARADVVSTFTNSAEGWTSNGFCLFNPASGNPAGDLDCGLQANGPTLTAPSIFLGHDSSAYGNTFSFDIFNQFSNLAVYLNLAGAGLDLLYVSPTGTIRPSNAWKTESIPLSTAAGWTVFGQQNAPTTAQFQSVLASLNGLALTSTIPTFTDVAFDNIRLGGVTPVPEPQAYLLTAAGIALLLSAECVRHCCSQNSSIIGGAELAHPDSRF